MEDKTSDNLLNRKQASRDDRSLQSQRRLRPMPDLSIRRSPMSHTLPSDRAGPFRRV